MHVPNRVGWPDKYEREYVNWLCAPSVSHKMSIGKPCGIKNMLCIIGYCIPCMDWGGDVEW